MRRVRDGGLSEEEGEPTRLASFLFGVPTRKPGCTTFDFERDGSLYDATWPLYLERDAKEDDERRRKQLAFLAYYGKQPFDAWDGVLLSTLEERYHDVGGVISELNEARDR